MVVYENARRCGLGKFPVVSRKDCASRFAVFAGKRFTDYIFYCRTRCRAGKNHEALTQISAANHEIGNHSFNHEPWLHLYSKQELVDESNKTEEAIAKITSQKLVGFRGPGYSLSPTVLEVLAARNYEYDCSTLPTYIAPPARAYYFFKSPEMSDEEREKRKKLFGKFSDGF